MHSHPVKVALPPLSSLEQGVLQCLVNGLFPKDQTLDTLTAQIQDRRVDMTTLYTQNLRRSLWCAHLSAACCCQRGVQRRLFSCGTYLTKGRIWKLLPLGDKFLSTTSFSSQKTVTVFFPADGMLFNFLSFGDVI